MADFIPMSRAGYEKLMAELKHLEEVEMPRAAERVAEARAQGDLRENAEYHGARETQGMIQAKINLLRDKLSRAHIVETASMPRDEVRFGATVRVRDLDFGEEEEFTLVGDGEVDCDRGHILVTSPLGQGLLGHKAGERVEIAVPRGTLRFEILEIRYEQ
ncbi:MAG: transcription elongation factor GreA [Pirellulales bacterium]|jgi:transcription elongation factor GreA|nr:transcription elongation factor GreA [Pirellulales bacterium]